MKYLQYNIKKEYFKNMPLFKGMSEKFFDSLPKIEKVYFMGADEEHVLDTCEDPKRFDIWIVIQGKIKTYLTHRKGLLYNFSPGHYFADTEAITGPKNNWFLKALTTSYLIKIPLTLDHLKTQETQHLFHTLIHSFTHQFYDQHMLGDHKRIVIIPAQRKEAFNYQNFKSEFTPFIKGLGKTLLLTMENMSEVMGIDESSLRNINTAELAIRLVNLETEYDYSFYMIDSIDEEKMDFLLNSADLILFLVDGNGPFLINPLADRCIQIIRKKKCEWDIHIALFWNNSAYQPREHARQWMRILKAKHLYNIIYEKKAEYARLIRLLTDNAIALVLGSGAGRGITHVGIYRAMMEANIPIDIVCGTSMGALVGAQVAIGKDWQYMKKSLIEVFKTIESAELSFSLSSLISPTTHAKMAKPYYNDLNIENFHYNFFCISTSLMTLKPVIHRFGPAANQVNASSALPVLFAPIEFDNDVLADGGATEPVPVISLRQLYQPKFVIGIDVSSEVEDKFTPSAKIKKKTFFDQLFSTLMPEISQEESSYQMIDVVIRLTEINSYNMRKQIIDDNLVDIYLRPNLKGIETLPSSVEIPNIIDRAYHEYKDQAHDWRKEISKIVPLFDDLIDS